MAHAVEQQMQKLLEETQLDMNEFDNLLQPIIDTCTKDAISVRVGGAGWVRCAQSLVVLTGGSLPQLVWTGDASGAPHLSLLFPLEYLQGEGRQAEASVGNTPSTVPWAPARTLAGGAQPCLPVALAVIGWEELDVQQCQVPATL